MAGKKKKRHLLGQLTLASRAARTSLSARLAEEGLHPGQDAALLAIAEGKAITLRELAEKLAVRPPTVTKTINRLAAQMLVEKRPGTAERRGSTVHLTERGESLVEDVRRAQGETERLAFAGLSAKQRKTLGKLLRRIQRNLGAAELTSAEGEDD
ncbi:MarR family winged helix-turn-helix transcriptional regulator [Aureimonas ureilytica]|uniref:MarR family winged helix-turn-helix transcriptional regulator n=1 Tax=Aureimonas ureilytica TaxID=401562 RepID=UPI003CF2C64D